MRTLLVTVGSTRFDGLIEALGDASLWRETTRVHDIDRVVVQHGACAVTVISRLRDALASVLGTQFQLTAYLKPAEMKHLLTTCPVIVAHGGAGTAFEVLRENGQLERFVMVANDALMDNHQTELIDGLIALGCGVTRGVLGQLDRALLIRDTASLTPLISGPSSLAPLISDASSLTLPPPNTDIIASILDKCLA